MTEEDSLALTIGIVLSGQPYVGRLARHERVAVVQAAVARGYTRPRIAELMKFTSTEVLATWCRRNAVELPIDPEPPDAWMRRWLEQHRADQREARQRWRDDPGNRFFRQDVGKYLARTC